MHRCAWPRIPDGRGAGFRWFRTSPGDWGTGARNPMQLEHGAHEAMATSATHAIGRKAVANVERAGLLFCSGNARWRAETAVPDQVLRLSHRPVVGRESRRVIHVVGRVPLRVPPRSDRRCVGTGESSNLHWQRLWTQRRLFASREDVPFHAIWKRLTLLHFVRGESQRVAGLDDCLCARVEPGSRYGIGLRDGIAARKTHVARCVVREAALEVGSPFRARCGSPVLRRARRWPR